jgi:hypothetical protein
VFSEISTKFTYTSQELAEMVTEITSLGPHQNCGSNFQKEHLKTNKKIKFCSISINFLEKSNFKKSTALNSK